VTIGGLVQEPGAGDFLEKEFGVPHTPLPLPIGLEFCDRLAACLEELTGGAMPECYERERGRLLDTMIDAHKIVADARTAVFGDTEKVLGLAKLMTELGMKPQIIATGATNTAFTEYVAQLASGSRIITGADYSEIADEVSNEDIDLMVGPFTGRQTARRATVPLLRVGLPNHDRFGASHQRLLGYEGSMYLVDSLANALIESREKGPA
jgi:nitrogenase molybdenum-iron protein NifN